MDDIMSSVFVSAMLFFYFFTILQTSRQQTHRVEAIAIRVEAMVEVIPIRLEAIAISDSVIPPRRLYVRPLEPWAFVVVALGHLPGGPLLTGGRHTVAGLWRGGSVYHGVCHHVYLTLVIVC